MSEPFASTSPPRLPGDWLWHPLPLVAAATLALNDRVLKQAYGSWWTGKLSDVAGLAFFPLLLLSLWELGLWALRRNWQGGRAALAAAIATTLLVFALINLFPMAGDIYVSFLGTIWEALARATNGRLWLGRVQHTVDPTDLLALPALYMPWAWGLRRLRRTGAPPLARAATQVIR